eukprot:COSAG06_NODE_15577_length_1060_cov_16.219563_2_plen_170_part_01
MLRCLLRLQATEAVAVAVERRMQEQVEATIAAKAQLAVTQLVRILYYRHCTHMRTAHAQTRRAAAAEHRAGCALSSPLSLLLQSCCLFGFHLSTAAPVCYLSLCASSHPAALPLPPLPTPPLQPLGFALEGHPDANFNGAYRKVSEHKGWPVLRNGAGMFCYRYEPTDRW